MWGACQIQLHNGSQNTIKEIHLHLTLNFAFDGQDLGVFDSELDLEGQGNIDRQKDTQNYYKICQFNKVCIEIKI